MTVSIDLRVPLASTVKHTVDVLRRCEAAGFDGAGIHDHPETGLDLYTVISAAAAATSGLHLYPAVTNIITRHPLVLASIASSLHEAAPGRFRMVVGTGDVNIKLIGEQPSRIATLGAQVELIRGLLQGREVRFGASPPLRFRASPSTAPPILMACAGPKGLSAAVSQADGAFLVAGFGADIAQLVHAAVASARPEFALINVLPFHLEPTLAGGRAWFARWWAALSEEGGTAMGWMKSSFIRWARLAGLDVPSDTRGLRQADLASMAEWIGLFGPPEYCAERMQELVARDGISHLYLWSAHTARGADGIPGTYSLPLDEISALAPFLDTIRSSSRSPMTSSNSHEPR